MRDILLSQGCSLMERNLERAIVPDPEGAAAFVAKGIKTTFTGGRAYTAAFNAKRYHRVKKHLGATHTALDAETGNVHVYDSGHKCSAWPDSLAIDGDRYIDTFLFRDGPIVKTPVWNASAEWFLDRVGLGEASL